MNFTNTHSKKLVSGAFPSYGMRGMDEEVFWEVFYQFNSIRYKIIQEINK